MRCQYKHFDTPCINVFQHLFESGTIKVGSAVFFVNIKMADRKCMLCDPLIDDAFLILNDEARQREQDGGLHSAREIEPENL